MMYLGIHALRSKVSFKLTVTFLLFVKKSIVIFEAWQNFYFGPFCNLPCYNYLTKACLKFSNFWRYDFCLKIQQYILQILIIIIFSFRKAQYLILLSIILFDSFRKWYYMCRGHVVLHPSAAAMQIQNFQCIM